MLHFQDKNVCNLHSYHYKTKIVGFLSYCIRKEMGSMQLHNFINSQMYWNTDLRRVSRYQKGDQNPKKARQNNGQKKNYERTNNDLSKHTHKTKDRVTGTPLENRGYYPVIIFLTSQHNRNSNFIHTHMYCNTDLNYSLL